MAYMRSLLTRARLVRRQCNPSFSYILHDNDCKKEFTDDSPPHQGMSSLFQWRSFGSNFNNSPAFGFFQDRRSLDFAVSSSIGASFCHYMSTTVGGGSENELVSDVANVLTDTTIDAVASQAPVVSEVAVAAADSFLPIKALQYFIDGIHSYTGFNWWASIVVASLLIRGLMLPLVVHQLKSTTKLTLIRPHLEEIKEEMQNKGMDPEAVAEGQKRMQMLFKEYGVNPFTPLKGLFIQGPIFISFFLAISNMVEKMPSFKSGGAYWFVDLTTPDSLYILPILTGLTMWITVESNMQEGMEGNPMGGTMKKVTRIFAIASVPLTMGFPKAVFCYWITSNLFSLVYGLTLKVPGVKKALGVPEIPVAPETSTPQPSFDLFSALKQHAAKRQEAASALPAETSTKPANKKVSSSAVLSQRIRSLEKQVKDRKKNRNR